MNFTLDFGENLPPETQAKIHDGMAQADANADVRWRHLIDHCVISAARKKAEISIDDVLDEFDALPADVRPTTHNWSALGPAMQRARRMGVIRPTDRVVRSCRLQKHGNRHNVWESKYFTRAN